MLSQRRWRLDPKSEETILLHFLLFSFAFPLCKCPRFQLFRKWLEVPGPGCDHRDFPPSPINLS